MARERRTVNRRSYLAMRKTRLKTVMTVRRNRNLAAGCDVQKPGRSRDTPADSSGFLFGMLPAMRRYVRMTMLRLKRAQREMLADKLPDTANLALGALVFGQFLATGFSWIVAVLGLALWILLMTLATRFSGELQ